MIAPDTESPGERDLFTRLRDDPVTIDWTVLHSLGIARHVRQTQGECDFVVIVPRMGVLCVEVKAHRRVDVDENGLWRYGSSLDVSSKSPFRQASDNMHSLRRYVQEHAPHLSRSAFWSAVIFPFATFQRESPEWFPWQVVDERAYRARSIGSNLEGVLSKAHELLSDKGSGWYGGIGHPSEEEAVQLTQLLRPRFEVFESQKGRRARTEQELQRYTDEQYEALDVLELNARVLFTGPAGVGKTLLALETARRSVAVGKRTLFLCYNADLGAWLSEEASRVNPPVEAMTLHGFMRRRAGLRVPNDVNQDFWETTLPEACLDELLGGAAPAWDRLVLDEAQDVLRDAYLDVLDAALVGGLAAGEWAMFGDFERQAIFGNQVSLQDFHDGRANRPFRFPLRVNCRNRPRTATAAVRLGHMEPGYHRIRREDDQVDPTVVSFSSPEAQPQLLSDALEALHVQRFGWSEIVILSPLADCAAAQLKRDDRWRDRLVPYRDAAPGQVAYTTIHAFKGLEAPVIVVTDIHEVEGDMVQSLLYVALTRPIERLVMLCSRDVVTSLTRELRGS